MSEPLQVHALEHGGVLVQYNCSPPCPEIVSSLRFITSGYDRGVILAPYDGMDAKIALTSWGKIDLMEEFDLDNVTARDILNDWMTTFGDRPKGEETA